MALDPRVAQALAALPDRPDPTGTPAERREAARARAAEMEGLLSRPRPALHEERDVNVVTDDADVLVRIYRPRPGRLPALIFIHGGGWWMGSVNESDASCRRRAEAADCVVLSVDYRLAPEHPFPAAVNDCWAATHWVFAHADELGIDVERIAIGGGSAGGNLAAAMTLLARDEPKVTFVAQVLEIPATDLTLTASQGSAEEFAEGYGLTKADLYECADFYLGDHDAKDPLASPLLADLHSLPPALVMTSECDPVRDDGEAYAAKLAEAAVPVTLHRWDGQVHGSTEIDVLVPDVAEAYLREVAEFLRHAFSQAG
ncbi:MAG: acetyl esterase [Frankiaceae bacterium]|jgi:acetyl esterase|nr:acetyl esterase [Frankiaceae bacterium]